MTVALGGGGGGKRRLADASNELVSFERMVLMPGVLISIGPPGLISIGPPGLIGIGPPSLKGWC